MSTETALARASARARAGDRLYLAEDAYGETYVWAKSWDGKDWPVLARRDLSRRHGWDRADYQAGADALWALLTTHLPVRES